MGREVKRVPLDFSWPLKEVWQGYLMPDRLIEDKCPDCKNGYSPRAEYLFDLWYGYEPFHPSDNGSALLTSLEPAVWERAKRNVTQSPDFYGTGRLAISREADRLAALFNSQWCHHLNDDDVAALIEADRLWDLTRTWTKGKGWEKKNPPVIPTAKEVNAWSLIGFGHDSLNAGIVVSVRCKREGVPDLCATCGGHSALEAYEGQRAEAEAWERSEPPTGDGWQLWETVTEGSPISPVLESAEALAQWMATNPCLVFKQSPDIETARRFVASGWAPSMADMGSGVVDGVTAVGLMSGGEAW